MSTKEKEMTVAARELMLQGFDYDRAWDMFDDGMDPQEIVSQMWQSFEVANGI